MKTAVFIGHSDCFDLSIDRLNNIIIQCINEGVTQFLSGGQGDFDRVCATSVFKLKEVYPQIKNVLVIPYLSFNIFNKEVFDEIIPFENFEKYNYKSAIPQRNRYMVKNSDVAICFVRHGWGNAVKTYEFAKRRKLKIFNLSTYDNYAKTASL